MKARGIWIDRLALSAGQKTAVRPTRHASHVSIGNLTAGDLEVHTTDDDDAHYLVITAGYERPLTKQHQDNTTFSGDDTAPAFWVKAAQSGSVVLIWL